MVRLVALAAALASHLVGQPVLPAAQSHLASRAASASDGIWIDVPFVKQAKGGCGSASVTMVMQYWGQSPEGADTGRIHEETYTAEAGGSYASSLKRYLQDHGFRAFAFRGAWEDLRSQLSKGRPLIVCLRPSKRKVPRHYVVVAGVAEDFEIGRA